MVSDDGHTAADGFAHSITTAGGGTIARHRSSTTTSTRSGEGTTTTGAGPGTSGNTGASRTASSSTTGDTGATTVTGPATATGVSATTCRDRGTTGNGSGPSVASSLATNFSGVGRRATSARGRLPSRHGIDHPSVTGSMCSRARPTAGEAVAATFNRSRSRRRPMRTSGRRRARIDRAATITAKITANDRWARVAEPGAKGAKGADAGIRARARW
jgi:hypothetical protein